MISSPSCDGHNHYKKDISLTSSNENVVLDNKMVVLDKQY